MSQVAQEILIKTKRKLFSQNLGNNETAFLGNGLDFSELREYYFGDDVRKINWKATAKEQKPFINLFTEERELNIILVYMISGSIYFGSKRIKQELMSEILALLAYSGMKNSDLISTIFFSDKKEYYKKPTKAIKMVEDFVQSSLNIDPLYKSCDYENLSNYLLERIKQKSIIFIIGDFFEDVDLSLLSFKHEVYAIIVRDRFEEDPKLLGDIELKDLVSGDEASLDLEEKTIGSYKNAILNHDKKLTEHFEANRIRHIKIYSDEDPFYKLNYLVK